MQLDRALKAHRARDVAGMTSNRSLLVLVLVVTVVVATIPGIVLAQDISGRRLLNEKATTIATIEVDGQSYKVNRYENTLPYASGIAIYNGDERVKSEAQAKRILTALARRRAAAEIGRDEARLLKPLVSNVNDSRRAASDADAAIDRSLSFVHELKNTTVDGKSAWARTVEAAPAAAGYVDQADEVQGDLRMYHSQAAEFTHNATALIALIESDTEPVPPRKLYSQYLTTLRTANDLAGKLGGFYSLSSDLRVVANTSERIATNASSVPEVGGEIEPRFTNVTRASRTAADRLDRLPENLNREQLDDAEDRVDARTEAWMADWRTRNNIAIDLYGTVFGLPIAGALVIGLGWLKLR